MDQSFFDKKETTKMSFIEIFKIILFVFSIPFKIVPINTVLSIIFRMFVELDALFYAFIFGKILDQIIGISQSATPKLDSIYPWLGLMFGYIIISMICRAFNGYNRSQLRNSVNLRQKQLLYFKIASLGIPVLEDPEFSNKLQRVREVMDGIPNYIEDTTVFMARILIVIVSALTLVSTTPWLIVLLVIGYIPRLLLDRHYMRKSWTFNRDTTEARRKAHASSWYLLESSPMHEILLLSALNFLHRKYDDFVNFHLAFYKDLNRKWIGFTFLTDFINEGIVVIGYLGIFKNLIDKVISIGDTTFLIRALNTLSGNIKGIGSQSSYIYEFAIKVSELKEIFDLKPSFKDGTKVLETNNEPITIEFKNVSFKYANSEKYVLKNLNLKINPGEKVAIVGENGAGKTTIVKLLCRLYQVNEGEILINNININELSIESWYKNLGVLFQDYNTYNQLSAKENIAIGDSTFDIDDEKVLNAAKAANAVEFINDYKYKFDQILSEKFKEGIRPSGGQWQKIAIARFFYRNSPVIIFDEPTAAIDAISEAKIFTEIYGFLKGKTVIIVSHRFSTVRNADRIIVLHKGEIIEDGTHKELLDHGGKYTQAFNTQAEGYL
jgi:ATP-binding cassette, subfamily B, bacterial